MAKSKENIENNLLNIAQAHGREVLPQGNIDIERYINKCSRQQITFIDTIRTQKNNGTRLNPSTNLIDTSQILTSEIRRKLLDKIASLVDENIFGRSDMCLQFAELLNLALNRLGIKSRLILGNAIYSNKTHEIFRWTHAWVRIDGESKDKDEIIDGNSDCLRENPRVNEIVPDKAFWGKIIDVTPECRLQENRNLTDQHTSDTDVMEIWWPELREFIDSDDFKQ